MKKQLPNFIVAGVMKAGTSAASLNLNLHPEVYCITPYWKDKVITHYAYDTGSFTGGMANEESKEMDFFNLTQNFDHGLEVYKSFFPIYSNLRGESTPNYFCVDEPIYDGMLSRMSSSLDTSNTKIIIVLRDPITRAYSHWNQIQKPEVSWGTRYKNKTFNECTEQASNPSQRNAILGRSKYINNLTSYREIFGIDNIYLTTQEAILANPLSEYNKMWEFLDTFPLPSDPGFILSNTGNYTGSIDSGSLEWCKTYFKEDVDLVKAMYPNLDYSGWYTY